MKMILKFTSILVSLSIFCIVFGSEVFDKIFTDNLSEDEINKLLSINDDGYRAPFVQITESVKNQYIITFHNHSAKQETLNLIDKSRMTFDTSFQIHHRYTIIPGFAATMNNLTVRILRHMKKTALIKTDAIMKIVQDAPGTSTCSTENNAEWCLSRVSNIDPNANIYNYINNAGSGIRIYILDTGVNISHPDLTGRATNCANFVLTEPNDDINGHGTACASLAAGTIAGVAKQANICSVKVMGQSGAGSMSQIIAGVQWITLQTDDGIVSISIGGSKDLTWDLLINTMILSGKFVVVSAGNDGGNACNSSPASSPNAYTVAASTSTNTLASFSNYGTCVKMIAPGTNCKVANYYNGGFKYLSGTSMCTSLVAGWAAIQKGINPNLSPSQMSALLNQLSLKNAIGGNLNGTPNVFINSNC